MNSSAIDLSPFQQPINRNEVENTKWGKYLDQDILPMWVADMDFRSPQPMLDAIHERVKHGVFGYQDDPQPGLVKAVQDWAKKSFDWEIKPEWLVWTQGMVPMLNVTASAFLRKGGQSVTLTPVYYHLFKGPDNWVQNPEDSIRVPLRYDPERLDSNSQCWTVDWDALEAAITPDTKLFMLCNPHNPVGKVYSLEELEKIADICERHDLVICSDEIHCQLILDDAIKHIPIATLNETIAQRCITLMAPSKTYNIAGLGCTFAIIPNPELKAKIMEARAGIVPVPNVLSFTATESAYADCDAWLAGLLETLKDNYELLKDTVSKFPKAKLSPLSATYLAWLDITDYQYKDSFSHFEAHGLGLSPGDPFGKIDERDFVRINFGCSTKTMQEACLRLEKSLS